MHVSKKLTLSDLHCTVIQYGQHSVSSKTSDFLHFSVLNFTAFSQLHKSCFSAVF